MDEQSQNESQPKTRRAKSSGAEEPQPNVTQAGSAGEAENVSEKLSQVGEEVSLAKSGLRWPFQATQHVAEEWTHFYGRAVERNARAADDLRACCSVAGVLRWQRELLQSNVEDWLQTSFAVLGVLVPKVPHAKAASESTSA